MHCHFRHTVKIDCIVGCEPYYDGMTNSPTLDERVTRLEYHVFEQLPPRMAAMNLGATQIYALTEANGEAIAGLRVDMAGIHADMFALKAAHDLQGDSLRKEIGVTRASLLSTMTTFRESMDRRFEDVSEQIRGVRGDVGAIREDVDFLKEDLGTVKQDVSSLKEDLGTVKEDVTGLKEKVTGIDEKLDTLIAAIRGSKN